MSYSISPQPPQKPPPHPAPSYSPYQNAGSPNNASPSSPFGPPPAKRQRMSPDTASSPNGITHGHHGMPTPSSYGNPYAQSAPQSPYGGHSYPNTPQNSFNTPQPYPYQQQHSPWQSQAQGGHGSMSQSSPPAQQSREMMPPPPRPNKEDREERAGVEDISDSLFGSGINLKDEENYMHSMYNNRHTQSDSFTTNQNSSFGSSTMSPNNSFNLLTQGTSFGSQDGVNGAFAGTMGQTMSQEDIEVEQRRKREVAARSLAEKRQHHLNNQFLLCNNVRKRMDRLALSNGVTVNMQGVFLRQGDTKVMVNGAGKEGIVATEDRVNGLKQDERPESVVNQNTPFEHVVSLVSLAAGERLRGLLDEAFAQARARKYSDAGRVPPEFSDIAEGEGKKAEGEVIPESITGSQWDKVPEESGEEGSSTPQPTVSFAGTLNASLRALADSDKEAEAARIKKREARKRAAADSTTDSPAEAAAPEAAAVEEASKPLTKKEQKKQEKSDKSSEAQLQATTNSTAAQALGKKASRYSWMTGGSAAPVVNRFQKTGGSGTATPSKKASADENGVGGGPATPTGAAANEAPKVPEWGDWREDKGIQMRDWVRVLERDGKERVALERAVGKLN